MCGVKVVLWSSQLLFCLWKFLGLSLFLLWNSNWYANSHPALQLSFLASGSFFLSVANIDTSFRYMLLLPRRTSEILESRLHEKWGSHVWWTWKKKCMKLWSGFRNLINFLVFGWQEWEQLLQVKKWKKWQKSRRQGFGGSWTRWC